MAPGAKAELITSAATGGSVGEVMLLHSVTIGGAVFCWDVRKSFLRSLTLSTRSVKSSSLGQGFILIGDKLL